MSASQIWSSDSIAASCQPGQHGKCQGPCREPQPEKSRANWALRGDQQCRRRAHGCARCLHPSILRDQSDATARLTFSGKRTGVAGRRPEWSRVGGVEPFVHVTDFLRPPRRVMTPFRTTQQRRVNKPPSIAIVSPLIDRRCSEARSTAAAEFLRLQLRASSGYLPEELRMWPFPARAASMVFRRDLRDADDPDALGRDRAHDNA